MTFPNRKRQCVVMKRVKRFVPASKYVRYHKKSGLWLPQRKRIYLLWFLYLRQSIREGREVDLDCYQGWGTSSDILNTRFDVWWNQRWMVLFGCKKGSDPQYQISTSQPKFDAMYLALKIYQGKHLGTHKELAHIFMPHRGWGTIHSEQTIVGRYIRQAESILDNVCKGKFP